MPNPFDTVYDALRDALTTLRPVYRGEVRRLAREALEAFPAADAQEAREEHVRAAAASSAWATKTAAPFAALLAQTPPPVEGAPHLVVPLLLAQDAIEDGRRFWPRPPAAEEVSP